MFKRAIFQVSLMAFTAQASEDTYSESLTILPLQNDFNLLSFDFQWSMPKQNMKADIVNQFPQ